MSAELSCLRSVANYAMDSLECLWDYHQGSLCFALQGLTGNLV